MAPNLRGHYAGFASRVVAFFLDLILIALSLAFITWIIVIVQQLLEMLPWMSLPRLSNLSQLILSGSVVGFTTISYFVFFWAVVGQTPGLRFMGLRVVSGDGRRPSGRRALVRMIGYVIATLPLYLGFLWVVVDDRRQGWHDKLARTFVIYDWEAQYGGRLAMRIVERRQEQLQGEDVRS